MDLSLDNAAQNRIRVQPYVWAELALEICATFKQDVYVTCCSVTLKIATLISLSGHNWCPYHCLQTSERIEVVSKVIIAQSAEQT